ncbi:serine hydrolase [Cellulomonas sp. SLBN-39]|uniref:serine hydrolase domain-containing protein n=1 Tax=Cellulomonas sp. SLBN-39 TaxID=2768446 RepID=UPI0011529B1E|nr:serine hydrolase domain-containing protein [Cellulomonas sp. SLBN-39]TQL02818.1 CubicO group peptidase (beta-lactamase class C family) [Cellulomonas sp. SLBN-39]
MRTHRTARRTSAALVLLAGLVTLTACTAAPTVPEPPPTHPASTAGLTTADVDAWLDDTLPAALEEGRIAGATVAVVADGEIVTARGFGVADVATGEPVDADGTLVRPGSVSKLVTATAVMQLVAQGDVDLDTDVERYTGLDLGHAQPVTLRHLLTHTAGYEERVAGLIGDAGTVPDLRASLVTDPPTQVYAPGTTPAYSNYGNALAGYVVEAVSGQPFEEYVAEHVLAPAGMTSSSFAQPLPDALAGRVAQGYAGTADDAPVGFEVVGQPPAGALSASTTDMARFMLAHLGSPVTGEALLPDDARTLMQQPALDASTLGALAAGPRMGLGWFDESRHGHRVVGHGGDTTAFHSHLQLWPDDDAGIFLSLTSTGTDGAAYLLRDDLLAAFADRYFPADAPAAGTVDDATRAAHARALAGPYESTRGFRSTFLAVTGPLQPVRAQVVDGDRVLFTPGPGALGAGLYEEVEPWVYQEVGGDRLLAVRTDDAGQVRLVGHDSAMSLVPLTPARQAVVPVLAAGTVVLVLALVAWPVGAVVRRVRGRRTGQEAGPGAPAVVPAAGTRGLRTARTLTRTAALAAVLALVGWGVAITTITSLADLPTGVLVGALALQWVAAAGVLAAVWRVVAEVRGRTGWARAAAATLVLVALGGVTWVAATSHLLTPDLTY